MERTKIAGRNEFSRGWPVLVGAFLGIGVSLVSLVYYSAGIWVRPWQEEFGWSRAEIGAAQMFLTFTVVLSAPIAGRLIDRFGLRWVATVSLFLYAIGLWAMTGMNGSLWTFYGLVVVYSFAGVASTPVGFTRVVNAWFNKNRGLALGLCLTSTGIAGALLPRILVPYVEQNGWRDGYMILVYCVLIVLPFVWLLIRDYPTELEEESPDAIVRLPSMTFFEAMRTRAFWSIGVMFLLIALAVCGLIPNFIPLLQDAGMSPKSAGTIGAIIGLSVMGGRLVTGFCIDRIFAPYVAVVVFSFVAIGCLALGLGGEGYAVFAAVALGFGVGAEVDLIGYLTAKYFGLRNYGALYGIQYSIFSFGCGISPLIVGYTWDRTGNYDAALIFAGILLTFAVIVAAILPKFPESSEQR